MPDISNPVTLHCVAPGGAGTVAVQQPEVARTGGLQPLEVVAGPLVEGDKSKPKQVSSRNV